MLVETNAQIPWTKPEDLAWDQWKPDQLGRPEMPTYNISMFDGAVRSVNKNVSKESVHKWMTPNGRESNTSLD